MDKSPNEIAGTVGRALLAGFAGTAALTAMMLLETRVTGPDQSAETEQVPAEAASKVTGVAVKGREEKKRMSQAVHWGYGTGWGAFRALLDMLGVRGFKATVLHFLAISTAASVMLPALHVAPPPNETPLKKIAAQSLNHFIYAAVVGFIYDALSQKAE